MPRCLIVRFILKYFNSTVRVLGLLVHACYLGSVFTYSGMNLRNLAESGASVCAGNISGGGCNFSLLQLMHPDCVVMEVH